MLAEHCQLWGAEVTVSGSPNVSAAAYQATAAAVNAVHAGVTAAGAVLAGRMLATAGKLVASGSAYENQDDTSAANLNAAAVNL